MQIREGGAVEVEEIVAVTMGPESAVRALHKAVSLGADRSVHLTDDALAGSDVAATGYALAKALETESPDLVLLGQQSDDGECYTIGAVVADHLKMPSLTQVIKMDIDERSAASASARPSTATTPCRSSCPAVISVGDAINEPRYPSLKAIMGAKKKPLETVASGDVGIDTSLVGERGLARRMRRLPRPAGQGRRPDHRGRGHERDGREDRGLARRKEADLEMADVLTYVLHYEGAFNKNSLGAVSRGHGASRRDRWRVPRGRRRRRRSDRRAVFIARRLRRDQGVPGQGLGGSRAARRRRDGEGDRRQRAVVRAVRRRPARVRDRRRSGRAQARRRDDGGHRRARRGRQARRRAPDPAGLEDLGVPLQGRPRDHHRPDQRVRGRARSTAARPR